MNKTQLGFRKYSIYPSYKSAQKTSSNPHSTKKFVIPTKSPKNLSLKPYKRTNTNMGSHIYSQTLGICKTQIHNTIASPYTYANTDLLTHYNSIPKQTHMNTKTMNSKQHAHRNTYTYKIKNLKSGFCIVDGK